MVRRARGKSRALLRAGEFGDGLDAAGNGAWSPEGAARGRARGSGDDPGAFGLERGWVGVGAEKPLGACWILELRWGRSLRSR